MKLKAAIVRRAPRGFTLIEMLIAMVVFLVIIGGATRVFLSQSRSVAGAAGRLDALQNARFAVNAIDRELRMAGVGVVDPQPMLVQAAPYAITFNADLVSRTKADVSAVYYDPDAPAAQVMSLGKAAPIVLPLSGFSYPDTNYTQGSGVGAPQSTAETISYWTTPDLSTPAADDYVLNKRVNGDPPRVVARSLVRTGTEPTFRYYKLNNLGNLVEIPTSVLPLVHTAKVHGSSADTAKSALSDSVVLVKIKLQGRYTDQAGVAKIRSIETNIRLMNSGLISHATCGESPIFGSMVTATVGGAASPEVTLTWAAAGDEIGGEKDVERYAIYRRSLAMATFGEPLASVAAGQGAYSFTDSQVAPGETWVYGVSAQDCTPANSPIRSSAAVTIPVTVP